MKATLDTAGFRRELARRGLTQTEFAGLAGVTPVTVSSAMAGGRVRETTIRKFARVLATTTPLAGTEGLIGTQRSDASASPSQGSVAEVSCDSASAL